MGMNRYEKLDFSNIFYKKYREFTPILNEYFSRMKVDMNLSDKELKSKINLMLQNVHNVKFGVMPKTLKGYFRPDKHKIVFNANLFNTDYNYEELFNIITHELDHACSYDIQNKKFGLYRFDGDSKNKFNKKDIFFDELRTDLGSTRRVFNDNYLDDDKMIRHTYAYKNFSCFSTVLQNCLGINEVEFLELADKGRGIFDKQMESKFANSKDYHMFMEKFAINASYMLNLKAGRIDATPENMSNFNEAFENITSLSYAALNLRMENEITNNPNIDLDKYLKNMRYSLEENEKNFNHASREFVVDDTVNKILENLSNSNLLNMQDLAMFENLGQKKDTKPKLKYNAQNALENKIMYLEMLLDNKELLGDKYKEAIEKVGVKEASTLKKYAKEKLNLEFKNNEEVEFKKELDSEVLEERKQTKENICYWDNTNIIQDISYFLNINKDKQMNKVYAKIMQKLYPESIIKAKKIAPPKGADFKKEVSGVVKSLRSAVKDQIEISNKDKDRNIVNEEKQKSIDNETKDIR